MLALAAVVYVGGRFIFSPRGRFVVATTVFGGSPDRVRPVLEAALARASQDLNLPPPYPELSCEADSVGQLCSTLVGLTPGVSTLQGNAQFTRRLLELGTTLVSGTEDEDGTVNLRFRAGAKVQVGLELVPAAAVLDTTVRPGPGLEMVDVRGRLALIVDDYGIDAEQSRRLSGLPGTFTAAVRPNQERAQAWANEARKAGMEVIVNLPMEPKNYPTQNPGDGAILVDLSGREIRKRVDHALEELGPAPGIKTYMGSLAVEDRDVMRALLEELRDKGGFFIDDTHSSYSTAGDLARELEIPFYAVTSISEVDGGRRNAAAIGIRFDDLVRRCRVKGYAIGIIHARDGTLQVLEERLPGLAREGIVVMGISEVMKVHELE